MSEPFLVQPARLRIPRSTLAKYRALWVLDGVFGGLGVAGLAAAAFAIGTPGVAGVVAILASFLLLPAVIGVATSAPGYRAALRFERGERALLYAQKFDGALGLSNDAGDRLLVRRGDFVTVHAGPNLGKSLFYVVVALKWTITAGGRMISFSTHFEPDPEFFGVLQSRLEAEGAVVSMTYRPLSHSAIFADM